MTKRKRRNTLLVYRRHLLYSIVFLFLSVHCCLPAAAYADGLAREQIKKGWAMLVRDQETEAMEQFSQALATARREGDTHAAAEALLYMGMCSYGSSYANGLRYATSALAEYKKLEHSKPAPAALGRSRCLQLISTIYCRQKKYSDAIALSKEALEGLHAGDDTTGTLGLVYTTLGTASDALGRADEALHYHRQALDAQLQDHAVAYLPGTYMKLGHLLLDKYDIKGSRSYFDKALFLADSSGNRQAAVMANLAMARWYRLSGDDAQAAVYAEEARNLSANLSDKTFYLQVLREYIGQAKAAGDYALALRYEEEMATIRESLYDLERDRVTKSLETSFRLSEKDRQLALATRERQVVRLTNYLLWGGIAILLLLATIIIVFLKRVNKRDRQLHEAREEVRRVAAAQQQQREQQLKYELEYKESQLSALALQMYQKSELMQELRDKLEQGNLPAQPAQDIRKILNRGSNQDGEWEDFNARFESLNRNFYTKLKQHFPDISPNDLRICALIKLNLSIKEMAGILNISPDSVKTARYRLRKKLGLNTEDNLSEFIMSLE